MIKLYWLIKRQLLYIRTYKAELLLNKMKIEAAQNQFERLKSVAIDYNTVTYTHGPKEWEDATYADVHEIRCKPIVKA